MLFKIHIVKALQTVLTNLNIVKQYIHVYHYKVFNRISGINDRQSFFSQHIDPLGVKLLHLHMGSMPGYCNCNYESKIQFYNGSIKNLHVNVSISTINQCYSHINKC